MTPRLLALALFCLPVLVHAQAVQTYVSGVGDDANSGIRMAPCKTFSGAISKTAAGGVITVLDPGGFGAVTITKAITIEGAGDSSVLVSGTNGIIISAATTDVVTIRNLNFEGLGTGISAIKILQIGAVHVENCQINGFVTSGVQFDASFAGTQLYLKDTVIHKCTGPGVLLTPTVAATVHIANSHISDCASGVSAGATTTVMATDTVCDNNSGPGFVTTAATAKMSLVRCTSSFNAIGIQSAGSIAMAECAVFKNQGAGLKVATGGHITTFSTNTVNGNTPDGAATATVTPR